MKIGIVTQPLGHNYGGILQNYALQQALSQLGHKPVTLRVKAEGESYHFWITVCFKVFILKLLGRKPRGSRYPSSPNKIKAQRRKQEEFVIRHIVTSQRKYRRFPECSVKKNSLDAIIVGSDQVWRPLYNPNITDMFLGFCTKSPIRRLAYAASFGVDKWEFTAVLTDVCRTLIKKFDAVSVRENSGIALCKEYLRCSAVEVLDPTFLLSREQYTSLCEDVPKPVERQLTAYVLDMNDEKRRLIERIADERNLTVRYFSADENATLYVEEWIAAFRDADFVVTDSFHGTVFSIIFNCDFYSILNENRGGSRFHSLLSKFNLSHRLISGANFIDKEQSIDWNAVNTVHRRLKEESLDFLRTNL